VVAHGVVIRESADERRPFTSAMNGMHHLVSPLSYFFANVFGI
jgi:hypothetical protein